MQRENCVPDSAVKNPSEQIPTEKVDRIASRLLTTSTGSNRDMQNLHNYYAQLVMFIRQTM